MSGRLRRRLAPPPPGILIDFPSVWKSRIGVVDTDTNLHLNNSSYFTQMELALDYAVGYTGIIDRVLANKWMFLVGSHAIRYRHAIPPNQPFEIHTQNIHWDHTWVYLRARFVCPETGKLYAEGLTRITLRKGRDTISPTELLRCLYSPHEVPELSPPTTVPFLVTEMLKWDAASEASMKGFDSSKAVGSPQNSTWRLFQSINWPWEAFKVPPPQS
ncbi:hypothetical protein AaE_013324 [Aphanomyces astaci]|uniref:Thioesterase domain-containing protein n=1 Tax=Aphanomyces astaci TaxID=112090 RepID=A0A6A4ZAL1_APHAT|nr:hypothetical protein AaE_013324 [Aphanomyces astaci]